MTKSGFNLESGNKEENKHIPIKKLKKIIIMKFKRYLKKQNIMDKKKLQIILRL